MKVLYPRFFVTLGTVETQLFQGRQGVKKGSSHQGNYYYLHLVHLCSEADHQLMTVSTSSITALKFYSIELVLWDREKRKKEMWNKILKISRKNIKEKEEFGTEILSIMDLNYVVGAA